MTAFVFLNRSLVQIEYIFERLPDFVASVLSRSKWRGRSEIRVKRKDFVKMLCPIWQGQCILENNHSVEKHRQKHFEDPVDNWTFSFFQQNTSRPEYQNKLRRSKSATWNDNYSLPSPYLNRESKHGGTERLYNEVLGITNDFLYPGNSNIY